MDHLSAPLSPVSSPCPTAPSSCPSRVNPCPKPAGLLQLRISQWLSQPLVQPLHQARTPDIHLIQSALRTYGKLTLLPSTNQRAFHLTLVFFTLPLAQHPAFDSSLQGMLKEKHGKLTKGVILPQHILPAAPDFPVIQRKKFSAQICNGLGDPALECSTARVLHLRNLPKQRRPPIPRPI